MFSTTDFLSVNASSILASDTKEFNQNSLTLVLLNKPIWRLVNLLTLYIPIAAEWNKDVLNGRIV